MERKISISGYMGNPHKKKESVPTAVPSFSGIYSYKQSLGKIINRLAVLTTLFNNYDYYGYLITITIQSNQGEYDESLYLSARTKILDLIKKKRGYYVGITELQRNGTPHYHIAFVSPEYWNYSELAVRWSLRYFDTKNSVDIKRREKFEYLSKYITKNIKEGLTSYRQLWTSNIRKTFKTEKELEELELYTNLNTFGGIFSAVASDVIAEQLHNKLNNDLKKTIHNS